MSNNDIMFIDSGASEIDAATVSIFVTELEDTSTTLETTLMELEKDPTNKDKINTAFRSFHNLKGSSAMMGYTILKELCHYSEGLLDMIRSDVITLRSEHVDLFMEALNSIRNVAACLAESGGEGKLRYFLLLHKLDEATIEAQLSKNADRASSSNDSKSSTEKKDSKKNDDEVIKVNREQVDVLMLLVGEYIVLKNRALWLGREYQKDRSFLDLTQELEQFAQKLQRNVLKLRLSHVGPVLEGMRRVVRSTAKKVNKQVDLDIEGQEILLDRTILDVLAEPLMHMVRNSIDHGLESPTERADKNKPENGKVTLKASYVGGDVHLSISDDGKGIDAVRIKQIILDKGLMKEAQLAAMSKQEIIQLIFLPGFSSAAVITETSGRGVGMDVVKSSIQSVGGEIDVITEVGSGTTITLKLPLSMSIIDSLSFEVNGQAYSIPQSNVEEVYSLNSTDIQSSLRNLPGGGRSLDVRGSSVPLLNLGKVFFDESDACESIVQVRYGKKRFALEVGKILGPISVLSQPLPTDYFSEVPFSGITTRGDGSLLFQLDVEKISAQINSFQSSRKKINNANRGAAGESQSASLLTSSEIRRFQQKVITFNCIEKFCVPVQRVRSTVHLENSEIKTLKNLSKSASSQFVTINKETVKIIWLEKILLAAKPVQAKAYSLILFEANGDLFGIPTADFAGIKRLPESYETTLAEPGVLGSSVIDNETVLLLDLQTLVDLEQGTYEEKKQIQNEPTNVVKKILFAEDDKFFTSELTSTLRSNGYETVACEDGAEAKKLLEDPKFASQLYCVVTDIEMPNMTGFQLVRWAKSVAHLKQLPFIAYTAISTPEMRKKMIGAGAVDCISKMSFEPLLKRIENPTLDKADDSQQANESAEQSSFRYISFYICDQLFCLPMRLVKQVSPSTPYATVPKAPPWANKLTFFKGNSIPVLDLNAYFNEGVQGNSLPTEQVVVEWEDKQFALFVNRVGEVVNSQNMSPGDGFPAHSASEKRVSQVVSGLFTLNEGIVVNLDCNKVCQLVFGTPETLTQGVAA
jgi:two-component system, chemotaxis family, sensor kinase CheA